MALRLRPRIVVRTPSPNYSQRTQPIRLIVLHSTEGKNYPKSSADLKGLGAWFSNPAAQVSCHVATDDDGTSARYVADHLKAWHCGGYNSASLGIEQVGYAADSRETWLSRRNQLRETARWIAYWNRKYGVPIRKGAVSNGSVTKSGVLRHSDLGATGGGHHDPGSGFPFGLVILTARYYAFRWRTRK